MTSFDPHALLPKDHPHHPDNAGKTAEEIKKVQETPHEVPVKEEPIVVSEPQKVPQEATTQTSQVSQNEPPKNPHAFKTEKKRPPIGLIFGVVLLLILGGAAYYGMSNGYFTFGGERIISPAAGPVAVGKKVSVGTLSGWTTYTSSESGFTIRHPESVNATVLREGNQVVTVFTLVGPSQKANTEFYDGISLQFMSGELTGSTLEEITRKESTELAEHAKITKAINPVTVSGINGYSYSASGIGDVVFIYLPDGGGYLKIANLTKDPTKQGYEKIVEDMLSTFRFTAEGEDS